MITRCGAEATASALCRAYSALNEWDSTGARKALYRANEAGVAAVAEAPADPVAWYVLGLVRVSNALAGLPAKEAPLMPLGTSQTDGAQRAFRRAIELDPSWDAAYAELARSVATFGYTRAERATTAVLDAAADRGQLPDRAVLLMAITELDDGRVGRALELIEPLASDTALSPAAGYLAARALFMQGEPVAAESTYYAAARRARDPAAVSLWRDGLAWIATTAELAEFDTTAGPSREAWLRSFWSRRDVADGRESGARLAEHFRRVEYALRHYRLERPRDSRRFGVVGEPMIGQGAGEPGVETEALGPNDEWIATGSERLFGADAMLSSYVPTQSTIDDRGIIYIRHGPPDQVAIAPSFGANESWRYDGRGEPMVFHFMGADFDGSSGATVLTPSLGGNRAVLASRCGFDHEACLLSMKITRRRPLSPIDLQRQHERGVAAIKRGTTTDSHPLRFSKSLNSVVQLYGVVGRAGGEILVVFAVPGSSIEPVEERPDGSAVYRIRTRVMLVPDAERAPIVVDTTRLFRTASRLTGEYLTGLIEVPAPSGAYAVTVVQEADSAQGLAVHLPTLRVPAAGQDLAISDLILGSARHTLRWHGPNGSVRLNPLNAFAEGERVDLFYQAFGLQPGADYSTRIELVKRGDRDGRPLVALNFAESASGSRLGVFRSIDIGRLRSGVYRIRVTLTQGDGPSVAQEGVLTVGD